ncbi:hypothetical protein [Verrucomicrobium spinosum]|uniref:hypothetical protein n=1 Tax=Verrucomicrobium spinosum TaxID=2736 RepID=UPI00094675C9|nr:hypothetical protein [Verrucomicrobium spinosum]
MLGKLDEEEQNEVITTIQATSQYLRECQAEALDEGRKTKAAALLEKQEIQGQVETSDTTARTPDESTASEPVPPPIPVFGRALHGQVDVLALEMLEILLPAQIELQISQTTALWENWWRSSITPARPS